jgi:hypothetical protein
MKEKIIGKWQVVNAKFYNVSTKEENIVFPPDISGEIDFQEKGWAIDVRREDGFTIKGGGLYNIKSNRVILKFFQGFSWITILKNDTLNLEIKPTPPADPSGVFLKFYKESM